MLVLTLLVICFSFIRQQLFKPRFLKKLGKNNAFILLIYFLLFTGGHVCWFLESRGEREKHHLVASSDMVFVGVGFEK